MLQDVNRILKSTQQLSEHREDLFTHMGENGNYMLYIFADVTPSVSTPWVSWKVAWWESKLGPLDQQIYYCI